MCGIVATFHYGDKKTPVNDIAIDMMQDQINRGENGFGAIFIDNKGKFKVTRATQQVKILVDNHFNESQMMILHHRMPSASSNKISQTHPIHVINEKLTYGYLVIHNGIIRNADKLKTEHEELGYKYTTDDQEDKRFNDSESLAIEMARFIEKQTTKVGAEGSCAFIALQYNKKTNTVTKIFYGRNKTNPLKLAKSRDFLYLSSEGKGEEIKENTLYSFNLEDFNIKKSDMTFQETEYVTPSTTTGRITDYNKDYDNYPTRHTIGYKTTDMADYEMEQTVDEGKEIIDAELEELWTDMKDKDEAFTIKLKERIKTIVGTIMIETQGAYETAINFYAKELMNESEEMKKEIEDKIKDEEIITVQTPIEKLYSR